MKKTLLASILLSGFVTISMATQPNIVLILADDVSADMFSCYGQPGTAQTPNIDRIAKEGVQFKTAFAPAICGPSRALLMTGVYANHSGAYRNNIWLDGSKRNLFEKFPSWAKLMQGGGYKTAVAGKWHVSSEPWEEVSGFDEYCMYYGPSKIKDHFGIDVIADGRREDIKLDDERYWYSSMIQNGDYVDVTKNDFGPDQRCDFLIDFMERNAKAGNPFVAYWPTAIPHGPYSTTPDAGAPMDIELKKPNIKGMSKEEKNQVIGAYEKAQAERFINLIEYMDKLIGKMVATTKELGIYDNTYFIFCADNGTASTAKDRGVERGVHVPFVVCGPGVKKIGITAELTDFSDIAPTLLDMGGVKSDVEFDGQSQLPFLTGKSKTHRDWIYAYTGPVQVLRTKHHLLEARAPFYDKPDGRFYYCGEGRFRENYVRADKDPEHAAAKKKLFDVIDSLPPHLPKDHPFWSSKDGKKWIEIELNKFNIKEKQLYNHADYKVYDETD
ncbi:Arylsulfatase [Pontiella desulfatans]|uniref:Arylsulfatase n=1 Tax=Pontiella desulfatans TaxID=2750659 RepID=A0A6C2U9V8_PONDE|nr:sulfatase-like hydrolase/transferase [Pontiella desulfatans]SPS74025.1 sulfatase S1_24 [Kiritimatiellales bacterium]VGO16301.1 Arylsulfatase [Pontiella desulfatans]